MHKKGLCNLCGGKELEIVKFTLRDDKQRCKVFSCGQCGHIQLMPRPTSEEERSFYNKNLQDKNRDKQIDYELLRRNNAFDTNRHIALFAKIGVNKESRILDIGAGYGFFVDALHEEGYLDVTGIETGEERRAVAVEHTSVPIIDYDIVSPAKDLGTFNVVTLFHVLEHIAAPIAFLRNIKALLKPGSLFICEVPNVEELLLEQSPAYNDFYWIRAHLNYFSSKTLTDCFQRAGLDNVDIRFQQRYGLINLCNWLSYGKPQIERPVFEIRENYKPVEKFYRDWLISQGKTDGLIARVRI